MPSLAPVVSSAGHSIAMLKENATKRGRVSYSMLSTALKYVSKSPGQLYPAHLAMLRTVEHVLLGQNSSHYEKKSVLLNRLKRVVNAKIPLPALPRSDAAKSNAKAEVVHFRSAVGRLSCDDLRDFYALIQGQKNYRAVSSGVLREAAGRVEHILQFAAEHAPTRASALKLLVEGMKERIASMREELVVVERQMIAAKENLSRDLQFIREVKIEYLKRTNSSAGAPQLINMLSCDCLRNIAELPRSDWIDAIAFVAYGKETLSVREARKMRSAGAEALPDDRMRENRKKWDHLARYSGRLYVPDMPSHIAVKECQRKVDDLKMAIAEHDKFMDAISPRASSSGQTTTGVTPD